MMARMGSNAKLKAVALKGKTRHSMHRRETFLRYQEIGRSDPCRTSLSPCREYRAAPSRSDSGIPQPEKYSILHARLPKVVLREVICLGFAVHLSSAASDRRRYPPLARQKQKEPRG